MENEQKTEKKIIDDSKPDCGKPPIEVSIRNLGDFSLTLILKDAFGYWVKPRLEPGIIEPTEEEKKRCIGRPPIVITTSHLGHLPLTLQITDPYGYRMPEADDGPPGPPDKSEVEF